MPGSTHKGLKQSKGRWSHSTSHFSGHRAMPTGTELTRRQPSRAHQWQTQASWGLAEARREAARQVHGSRSTRRAGSASAATPTSWRLSTMPSTTVSTSSRSPLAGTRNRISRTRSLSELSTHSGAGSSSLPQPGTRFYPAPSPISLLGFSLLLQVPWTGSLRLTFTLAIPKS